MYSHNFRKNCVKSTQLMLNYTVTRFNEISFKREYISRLILGAEYSYISTVWKNEKFTVTEKKIRQINSLVTSLGSSKLISRIFLVNRILIFRSSLVRK